MQRKNERGRTEVFFPGEHLGFPELAKKTTNSYLARYQLIPLYHERVEFCVSNLRHDTNYSGFQAIMKDGGLKKPGDAMNSTQSLVWWSLAVSKDDIAGAEKRFLASVDHPECKPFLHKFTTSPAFKMSSRMGNFRFTFPLRELLATYSIQFCKGQTPQIRIYETVVYKQEVMYALVVHGPEAQREFQKYPLLQNSHSAVRVFNNEMIWWRPEGMCTTNTFRLSQSQGIRAARVLTKKRKWFPWDHMAVAFHVPQGSIFKFDQEILLQHLSLCQGALPKLSNEDFIKCEFEVQPPQGDVR
ncbi:uncharacterized protein si:ch211-197h24.8 [Hoplias malabaricus]|uniref:uncharacterized protein si:ch211-197h24.8 n=1 Tax=Hoplias malabaricus TaxID=27720 RepID=UPI003462886E